MKYYVSSMLVILMGSMDCLTTVIGTQYFGTQELNPLIANLVHTNLPGFVIVKLTVSVSVGFIFILAEKTLRQSDHNEDKSFRIAHKILRATCIGVTLFLAVVVINNTLVLIRTLSF